MTLGKPQSKVRYWAKRLECPVDEDAGYHNTFMYWGGQSIKIILDAIIGRPFRDLDNTLPASANADTASLICFFVFAIIFLPTLMVPPERLQMPFRITFVMITCSMFGILGWAISTAGGPDALFHSPSTKSGAVLSRNAHRWQPSIWMPRDYFLVRKGKYHIGDLYEGSKESPYWYCHGFNLRGYAAWIMGLWPLLPGFVRAVRGTSSGNGWDHIYAISYFYGFFVALLVHWVLHAISPASKQSGSSPFVLRDHVDMPNAQQRFDGASISVSADSYSPGESDGPLGLDDAVAKENAKW